MKLANLFKIILRTDTESYCVANRNIPTHSKSACISLISDSILLSDDNKYHLGNWFPLRHYGCLHCTCTVTFFPQTPTVGENCQLNNRSLLWRVRSGSYHLPCFFPFSFPCAECVPQRECILSAEQDTVSAHHWSLQSIGDQLRDSCYHYAFHVSLIFFILHQHKDCTTHLAPIPECCMLANICIHSLILLLHTLWRQCHAHSRCI